MSLSIWYISKYAAPTYCAKASSRAFCILSEFSKLGHDVQLVTSTSNHLAYTPEFKGKCLQETIDNVSVLWVNTFKYNHPKSFKRVISWFHFEFQLLRVFPVCIKKPDVIIASSLSLFTILSALLLSRLFSCKVVFEVRDVWPLVLTANAGYSRWNPLVFLLGIVEKIGYQKSDLIVSLMPNLEPHVSRVAPKSTAPLISIPHGIEPSVFNAQAEYTQDVLDYIDKYFPSEKFIICHAGSIGTDNALETFFVAANKMKTNPEIHFLLIGEGYLKQYYQSKYSHLPNLTFAPRIDKNKLQLLLKRVQLLYFATHKSSLLEYGQSLNKLIDYMFSAKPIVASLTGYHSMINEADCGTFVPAEDSTSLCEAILFYQKMSVSQLDAIGSRGKSWLVLNRTFPVLSKAYLSSIESICEHSVSHKSNKFHFF